MAGNDDQILKTVLKEIHSEQIIDLSHAAGWDWKRKFMFLYNLIRIWDSPAISIYSWSTENVEWLNVSCALLHNVSLSNSCHKLLQNNHEYDFKELFWKFSKLQKYRIKSIDLLPCPILSRLFLSMNSRNIVDRLWIRTSWMSKRPMDSSITSKSYVGLGNVTQKLPQESIFIEQCRFFQITLFSTLACTDCCCDRKHNYKTVVLISYIKLHSAKISAFNLDRCVMSRFAET